MSCTRSQHNEPGHHEVTTAALVVCIASNITEVLSFALKITIISKQVRRFEWRQCISFGCNTMPFLFPRSRQSSACLERNLGVLNHFYDVTKYQQFHCLLNRFLHTSICRAEVSKYPTFHKNGIKICEPEIANL